MKKIFLTVILVLSIVSLCFGAVTINWIPPTENEDGTKLNDLAGYRIYYGEDSGNYKKVIRIKNKEQTNYILLGHLKPDKTYYFVITAFDTSGNESDPSKEVSYHTPKKGKNPKSPTLLKIKKLKYGLSLKISNLIKEKNELNH